MKLKTPIFRGAATALVTPMTKSGVDYQSFERLINWQIDSGIDALVICGTTGELNPSTRSTDRCLNLPRRWRAAGFR